MKRDRIDLFIHFFTIFLGVSITVLLVSAIIGIKSDTKNSIIENYNKVYAALSDTQKHKADSLPPVCTEEAFNEYRCARRTDLLEKAYVFSDDDMIQSDRIMAEVTE